MPAAKKTTGTPVKKTRTPATKKASIEPPQPVRILEGKELVTLVKALSGKPQEEVIKAAGYFVENKETGKIRLKKADFTTALLVAKGIRLGLKSNLPRRGREATGKTTKHSNGQIVIGSAYTAKFSPDQEFSIKVSASKIVLTAIDPS